MTRPTVVDRHGTRIALVEVLADGGEGTIWRTATPGILAKIYHKPSEERAAKIAAMLAARPDDPGANPLQPALAWPEEAVLDGGGYCVGFTMREAPAAHTLPSIYVPALRKAKGLAVDWRFLHAAAYNLAVIMKSLHRAGYVVGDLKPQNLLVNAHAVVTITDTDSFQVPAGDGQAFRCPVGSEGFTPPELLGLELTGVDQTPAHDAFRLGVATYLLLFGRHPFQGLWDEDDDPPGLDEAIRLGEWCHGARSRMRPPPSAPALDAVGPELASLFRRCFDAATPADRPAASAWAHALREAMDALQKCPADLHFHQAAGACPWCAAAEASKLDVFAAGTAVVVHEAEMVVPKAEKVKPKLLLCRPARCTRPHGGHLPRPIVPRAPWNQWIRWNAVVGGGSAAAWFALLGAGLDATLPILGSLAILDLFVVVGWFNDHEFARNCTVLSADVVACWPIYDRDGQPCWLLEYGFATPSHHWIMGKQTVPRSLFFNAAKAGTPLAVAYMSDNRYELL